jgi:glucuronide carrier protein
VWAYATYGLFQVAYSFVDIPYGSLASVMTQDPDERAKLAMSRSVAASVAILVIALVISPQVSGSDDLQRSFTISTIGFAVLGLALYLWCFATSREAVQRETHKVSMRETIDMLRSNRPLILLCTATLVFLTGMFALQTVAVYYARDVLGNADLYIVLTLVQTAGMLVAAVIVPKAAATVGKKRTFLVAGGVGAVAALAVALTPFSAPGSGSSCTGCSGCRWG